MGKWRTSLLSIVSQLFLVTAIFADEEVRSVQKELRKRHLFHGDSTGETSPVLRAAIRRYQQIKGFTPTGLIDWETAASLGITGHVVPAPTPLVVDNKGDVRGANGEVIAELLPRRWASDEGAADFEAAATHSDPLPLARTRAETEKALKNKVARKRQFAGRPQRSRPRKETNPFVQAFSSIDHARKFLFGDVDAKKKRKTGKRL
jgi:peptidoglycan hydrolase-like protein with peptidoglycan-binding domain